MATHGDVEDGALGEFSCVTAQIERTFNQLIDQLIGRKEALLKKVLRLLEDYREKESSRKLALQELVNTQEELKQLSLRADLSPDQEPTKVYNEETDHPSLSLSCPTRHKIAKLIENFGELVEIANYSNMREPVLSSRGQGKGVGTFTRPTGLALDEANNKIYIADHTTSSIQVFSFEAEFITQFGGGTLDKPFGITTTEDRILVTDNELHSLFRFDKKTLQLIDRAGGEKKAKDYLNDPRGLAVDTNGDIFIVDNERWLVLKFSKQLEFLSSMGKGTLDYPLDVKLTAELVIVLNWSNKCIHIFSRSGEILSSLVSHDWGQRVFGGEEDYLVKNPYFFCLDRAGNFIISDNGNHEIKILDSSGAIIHTVGRGHLLAPMGIAISDAGRVYVVASVGTHCVLLSF